MVLGPTTDFDGRAIWRDGHEPGADEIAERTERWHRPYHDALAAQIGRVRACHGVAILYDCHSIRSDIPFLFDGTLPAFNIGTNNGETCAPAIEQAVTKICRAASDYDTVVNGRFKGGWTTRTMAAPKPAPTPSRWSWRSASTWSKARRGPIATNALMPFARSCRTYWQV